MTAESLPRMVRRASRVRAIRHQLQREFYARWEESKHPRDEDGKFSEKDGGKRSRKAPRKTLKHFPALSMRLDDYIEKNHPNVISLALYKEGGPEWFQEHYPDVDLLEDIFRPEREVKEEWQFQARAAFSVGAITADDLNTLVETYPGEKGVSWKWSGVGRAQPDGPDKNTGDLPETLYHATTAATPVEEVGLKSREELNQSFGAGLGGGDDDTISFTTDRELAEVIASTIKLGRRVARGEVTVDDLMRDAREGVGTNGKPYDSDQLKKQVEDIHRPQRKFGWKPTVATDSDGNPTSYEASFGPWEPDPKHEPNEKGNHVHWVRYPNEEQVLDRTMSAFKYWLAYREAAGGPPDPLFFLSDAAGLANLDEDEIKVVEAKPVEGAKGYQVSAMSEWRTWSGDSVDIVDIYRRQLQAATDRGELDREFYRRGFYNKQFDESKINRDEGGKFAEKSAKPQTSTPEFKRWFGDSKMVDNNGDPIVFYHGTASDKIEEFDPKRAGSVMRSDWGEGVYFTPRKSQADYYRTEAMKRSNRAVNEAWEAMENHAKSLGLPGSMYISVGSGGVRGFPRDSAEFQNHQKLDKRWREEIKKAEDNKGGKIVDAFLKITNPMFYTYQGITDPYLPEIAKGQGHDGIVILASDTGDLSVDIDEIVVFDSGQIKSASGNSGNFDPDDPRITYARRLQSASYARRLNREFTDRGFYANAKFDESKVKRDKDGKFATKSGSGITGDSPAAKMLRADEEARKKALENQRAWDELQAAEAKAKADAEKAKAEAKKKFWSVKRGSNATVNAVRNLEKTQQLLMDDLIDITNKELDKKGRVTSIRIGSSETEVVDERMAELKTALWGSTAGHDSLMDRIPNLSDTARVYAKKAVNARLTDRMMPAAIKFYSSADDFMESSGRRRFFDNEEDIREHVERVVRDWVDQWAATSGKGPEAIALQLAALEEFDLGEDERFSIVDVPEWSWDESRERSPHIRDWTDDELYDNFDMYETISKVYRAVVRSRRSLMGSEVQLVAGSTSATNDPTRLGFVDTANNLMDSIADGNGEWLKPPYSPAGFRVPQEIPTTKFEFDEAIDFLVEVRQSISDSSRGGVDDAGRPVPAPDKWHDASTKRRTDLLRSEIEHIDSPEREEFLDNPPGHTATGVDHLSGARFKHYAYTIHTMFQHQIEALMDLRDLGNRPPKTEMDEETREDPDRMPTEEEAWHMSMQGIANRASYAGFDAADIWRGVGHLKKEYTSTLKLLAQVPKPLPGSSEEAAWIKAKREAEKGLADLAKYPDRPDERATSNYPAAAEKIFNTVAWASQDKETRWSKEQARIRAEAANAKNKDIKEAQKIASDKQVGPMMRAFVRAQYDETQEKLAEAGYEPDDTIALYRGMNFSDEQMPEALKGGSPEFTESETVQSAMSSYSMNFNEAMSFAVRGRQNSAMAAAHVPVGSILSLPTTGVGCLTEGEVVVLRNDGKKYISVSEGGDPARDEMYEHYLEHLRQNWQGPTGQRLDNGHGDDLVPDRHGDAPAWYSRSR